MPGQARPLFLIGAPFDGQPHAAGNGQMTALLAPSRAAVDQAYALALAHGGASEGEPGQGPDYHAHYYGAYLRDPDGNKLRGVSRCADLESTAMNEHELSMPHARPKFEHQPTLCHVREQPIDPRTGLNRWQRFLYTLKILTGRETFEQRIARHYYD